jgi:hypothetical protein
VLLAISFVGNTTTGVDEQYRFPGPYVYGSDARSITTDLLAASAWFRSTQGPGHGVVADRFSGAVFASFGRQWTSTPSSGFPAWELYLKRSAPPSELVTALKFSRFRYMVVDRRMARFLPRIGFYLSAHEPGAFARRSPPPLDALTKYERLPWAIKIYSSNNIDIYRYDFGALPSDERKGGGHP